MAREMQARSHMETSYAPADTTLVIRCPHCFLGTEYRQMTGYKDGRFVCRYCGHTVRPGEPEYECTCRGCRELASETRRAFAHRAPHRAA